MKLKVIVIALLLTLVATTVAQADPCPGGESRSIGGNCDGGGGDIIIWDIVDSAVGGSATQSASGGGPHVVVFDGNHSVTLDNGTQTQSAKPCPEGETRGIGGACGGGGDIIVWDIV